MMVAPEGATEAVRDRRTRLVVVPLESARGYQIVEIDPSSGAREPLAISFARQGDADAMRRDLVSG